MTFSPGTHSSFSMSRVVAIAMPAAVPPNHRRNERRFTMPYFLAGKCFATWSCIWPASFIAYSSSS